MDEVEQNIVICLWRADQLLAEAEDWGKWQIYEILTNHDILRQPSSTIVLSLDHRVCFFFIEYLWEANRSAIFTQEPPQKEEKRGFIYAVAKYYSQRKKLDDIAHEQTIICWQLFAGHVVSSRPMKRKKICNEW